MKKLVLFFTLLLVNHRVLAEPNQPLTQTQTEEVEQLKTEIKQLKEIIKQQKMEIQRLKTLCEKTNVNTTTWKIVEHFGLITTVYIDKESSKDISLIAQILHVVEGKYSGGAIWFFYDEKYTPQGVPMTDDQMLHWIGMYDPTQFETFQYVEIVNPNVSPPEAKMINTNIRPGYAEPNGQETLKDEPLINQEVDTSENTKSDISLPVKHQVKNFDELIKIEQTIAEMKTKGLVHSINIDFNEVRMDPVLWIPLPLEAKQGLVMLFSKYFDGRGSTGRVTILSNRNDKKLASYSVWTGVKIYE